MLSQVSERNQVAHSLLPLVQEVAAQVARRVPSHVTMDDLVAAGMLGLAGALTRLDPERIDTFRGYAEFRIRGAIIDELRRRDIMSRDARIASKKLQRSVDQLSAELGRDVEDDEIAEHLGISLEDYREMQTRLKAARLVTTEGLELVDESANPFQWASREELRGRVASAIEALPKRHALVLWLYYYEELPLRDIANQLEVTPSRVCQIRTEAVNRVRNMLDVGHDA